MAGPIQRPPEGRTEVVWVAPTPMVSVGAAVLVHDGEQAVFVTDGRMIASLGPGQHRIDPAAIPALHGICNGPMVGAQLALVATTEVGWIPVAGPVGMLIDPLLGGSARSSYEATVSARAIDVHAFVSHAASDLAGFARTAIGAALGKSLKAAVAGYVLDSRVSLLDLDQPAHAAGIAARVQARVCDTLAPLGLEVVRFGSLAVRPTREDADKLARIRDEALASTERAAVAQPPPPYTIGAAVEVPWSDGATYAGIVGGFDGQRLHVRWDGTDRADWIALEHVRLKGS
ncbi:MAG: SPFH domain-containing protein [Deltaproteobacteria bacterium]|nr:SPFH domain-containing protein [Deltaproteobacteria bacterium]